MSKGKILIVEDAVTVAAHLRKSITSAGHTVIASVTSGEEAIEFTNRELPDLILMDIMLDGKLDGIETSEIIKKKYDLPIIYLTALTDHDTIERAKLTSPFGYVMKPFNEKELHANIDMVLHNHRMEMKLKASEAKYHSTVQAISDVLLIADKDLHINYMNPAAEELFQKTKLETSGHLDEVVKLYDEEKVRIKISQYINNPEKLQCHHFTLSGLEEPILGQLSINKTMGFQKEDAGYVIILRDVTSEVNNNKLKKALSKKNLTTLIEGQEIERMRIAREIHDGIGQMLTGIKMHLDFILADSSIGGKNKSALIQLLDETVQETSRISEGLIPSKLKQMNLIDCISSLCKSLNINSGPGIDFFCSGDDSNISESLKINIYRIVQEAITNALKHGKCHLITVQLNIESRALSITIEDDGKGFDVHKALHDLQKPHHGLQNIYDRVNIMNGVIDLESSSQLGTLVRINIPLE